MSENNIKIETRGRPRKNQDQKLPPISRKLFSEHCAVFYACCMVYVLEIFLKTKQEKRIGHSEGGFTIYQKMNVVYCFENFEEDIKEWGYSDPILDHLYLYEFTKTVNGCAPKFVFKELIHLIVSIHRFIEAENIQSIEELQANQHKILNLPENQLNKMFKYIRFSSLALKEIKMDKWNGEISKKIKQLWRPFLKIISYTTFCAEKNIQKNKYLKPFFSDAEHPEETIIGQLNLEQIIEEKYETYIINSNVGFTKISKQSIDELNNESSENLANKIKVEAFEGSPQSLNNNPNKNNKRPIMLITFPSNQSLESKQSPSSRGIILLNSSDKQRNSVFNVEKNIKEEHSQVEEKNSSGEDPCLEFQSIKINEGLLKMFTEKEIEEEIEEKIEEENDDEFENSEPTKKIKF